MLFHLFVYITHVKSAESFNSCTDEKKLCLFTSPSRVAVSGELQKIVPERELNELEISSLSDLVDLHFHTFHTNVCIKNTDNKIFFKSNIFLEI